MKKINLFVFASLISLRTHALEVKTEKLPPLTNLLVIELSRFDFLTEQEIKNTNSLFNQCPSSVESFDGFILKNLLTSLNSGTTNKGLKIIDQKLFETLNERVNLISKDRVFTLQIYQGLLSDLGELLTDAEYKNYLAAVKFNKTPDQGPVRFFYNKVKLITPWIRLLLENSSDEAHKKIDQINLNNLESIKRLCSFISRTDIKNNISITYIEKRDLDLEKAKAEIDALTFEIAPEPDPNYVAPQSLPTPVDSWEPVDETIIEDGLPLTKDRLFPEPDPNYIPPKVLPKPVNKW